MVEGRTIQGCLRLSKTRSSETTTQVFTNLMLQGRVAAAMRIISEVPSGILDLEQQVSEGKTVLGGWVCAHVHLCM